MWLRSSGPGFESRWSPDFFFFFQASSFQLLKLENLLRWSFFTSIYNRSSKMNHFIYTSHHLNFRLKTELPWPLMCKLYLKKSLKLCRFGFFSEQDKRSTVKKPTRLKSLRANQCSAKSFFSAFSTKRKLIDDSFEHSGSHLCLKTVHLALHWEATQQKSPQYPFSFPGKQELPYDKLTIFTRSRKKHRQQLVLVFRQL